MEVLHGWTDISSFFRHHISINITLPPLSTLMLSVHHEDVDDFAESSQNVPDVCLDDARMK